MPEEADARWIVSAFSSGDPAGTFAVASGALKWRASNCRVENVPSAGNDFANDLSGVKVLDGARGDGSASAQTVYSERSLPTTYSVSEYDYEFALLFLCGSRRDPGE